MEAFPQSSGIRGRTQERTLGCRSRGAHGDHPHAGAHNQTQFQTPWRPNPTILATSQTIIFYPDSPLKAQMLPDLRHPPAYVEAEQDKWLDVPARRRHSPRPFTEADFQTPHWELI